MCARIFFSLFLMVLCTATPAANDALLSFQVIDTQFDFNYGNIKSASIVERKNGYAGMRIELKPAAAQALKLMTLANIGKRMALVLNNRIISISSIDTGLGDNLLISSITKEEALELIKTLRQQAK